ncbi:monocarboxylate transporter 4-like [Haliotis rubra]|uniref:monocarboxylate transporter 4-like n=1 Tax=Haliotis rubra TaxID=36100 RepID=UPI001EE59583|nr:monocarboxylate transporter 4-like [Haliotis rubra]
MKEESKASFDVALSTVGGQFGCTIEGPFGAIEQHETLKNPDESTVTPAPDGGRGWIILLAACLLLSATSIYRTLQPASISVPQRPETTTQTATTSTVNGNLGLQPTPAPPHGSPGTAASPSTGQSQGGGLISSVDRLLMAIDLNRLLNMFNAGDHSVVQNITSILFALNHSSQAEKFLEGYRKLQAQTNPVVTTVVATNGVCSSVFGVFSSTLVLLFGYRCTALAGSLVVGLGILGAYFCDHSNIVLVSFLYGVLTGIGQNMIYVSSLSAVMEYFKRKRLIALTLLSIGNLLVIVPFVLLMVLVFPSAGMVNSRSYFILQFAVTGLLIPVSLMLKPLHLRIKGPAGGSLISRQLGIQGLTIYKKPVLYTVTLTFFFWDGGFEIINKKVPGFKGLISIPNMADGLLLTLILSVAVLLGVCIAFCTGRFIQQRATVIIFCVNCVSICFFCFLASQLSKETYATVYSAVVGLLKGFTDPIILFTIPMFVGDNNMSIGIGMVTLGQGLGKFLLPYLADEIEGRTKKLDLSFYLVGGLYLMGCGSMLLTYGLHKRAKIEDVSPKKSDGKAAEPSTTISAVKVEGPTT